MKTVVLLVSLCVVVAGCSKSQDERTPTEKIEQGVVKNGAKQKTTAHSKSVAVVKKVTVPLKPTSNLSEKQITEGTDALMQLGDKYVSYVMVTNSSPIEISEISLDIVSKIKSANQDVVKNGTQVAKFENATTEEQNAIAQKISAACTACLIQKCKVEKQSRYRIVSILTDFDGIKFRNGRAMFSIDNKIYLLDTQNKQILWYYPRAGINYSNFNDEVITNLGKFTCDALDMLFNGTTE